MRWVVLVPLCLSHDLAALTVSEEPPLCKQTVAPTGDPKPDTGLS